jgi:hypothetical protein
MLPRRLSGPSQPRLVSAERLRGSSRNGVYRLASGRPVDRQRLHMVPGGDFWTAQAAAIGPFAEFSGPDLFEASHSCLEAANAAAAQGVP